MPVLTVNPPAHGLAFLLAAQVDAAQHSAIAPEAHADIMRRLAAAEQEHDITILWAIESGSRAWGFHSPDSDYDCRFVYARHADWYLSIDVEDRRDVIEYPILDEMDINGWDVRKALRLMAKSNCGIVEWLHSPIVYQRRGDFAARAQAWLATHYSVEKGIYHYRSAAKKNFSQYLCSPQVSLKKYLYVLRPLLAVRWLERYGEVAPIEFEVLRTVLDHPTVQAAIDTLLAVKRHVSEQATQAPVAVLHDWIVQEIARLQHYQGISGQADPAVWPTLNTLFVEVLRP
jgi:predicted nucleotidyltransferase